ncbi:phospholipid-transporting ATPase, putative, partial [Perkinsus marinus ATCC 50983]
MVRESEPLPADMILLSSSHGADPKKGCVAYMETSNLDGETNLKTRQAPKLVSDITSGRKTKRANPPASAQVEIASPDKHTDDDEGGPLSIERQSTRFIARMEPLAALVDTMTMQFEAPTADLLKFRGSISPLSNTEDEGTIQPLSMDNMLLRGCKLKNTPWAIGVVVYAGHESRFMISNHG